MSNSGRPQCSKAGVIYKTEGCKFKPHYFFHAWLGETMKWIRDLWVLVIFFQRTSEFMLFSYVLKRCNRLYRFLSIIAPRYRHCLPKMAQSSKRCLLFFAPDCRLHVLKILPNCRRRLLTNAPYYIRRIFTIEPYYRRCVPVLRSLVGIYLPLVPNSGSIYLMSYPTLLCG